MKCDGCDLELNVVPVKVVWERPGIKTFILDFNYCPECIKSDIEKDSLGCIIGLFIIILILALIDKT